MKIFFIVSKDDALRQIENAKFLINEIIQFVKKYYGIEL